MLIDGCRPQYSSLSNEHTLFPYIVWHRCWIGLHCNCTFIKAQIVKVVLQTAVDRPSAAQQAHHLLLTVRFTRSFNRLAE